MIYPLLKADQQTVIYKATGLVYIVSRESKTHSFDFYIFQERQKTE